MRSLLALATVLAFTIGCGGDGGGGGLGPPQDANVAGSWTVAWSNMSGGGVSCHVRDVRMQLSQSGSTFTGSTSGGEFSCGEAFQPFRTFQVVNGSVNENQVAFDLNDQSFHQTGSVSGNSMTGTAIWTTSLSGVTLTLNGTWSAAR